MPTFLSTTETSASPAIEINTHGTHQLALRRMSEKGLAGSDEGVHDSFGLGKGRLLQGRRQSWQNSWFSWRCRTERVARIPA